MQITHHFESCMGCEFLDSQLLKTGRSPIREYRCTHPNVENVRIVQKHQHPITPNNCPKLKGVEFK